NDLMPALQQLADALQAKAVEFDDVVKSGRTHLMDAVPVTLGQEFGGYAAQVRQGYDRVGSTLERLGQIPLGGTAVGTGLNTHPEFVTQVAAQVIGNDAAITVGGMQGHFELNVFVPLLARNLLDSIKLLSAASRLLAEKCVDGIEANREACERYAELTLSAATALNPYIGYDAASEIVKEAASSGRSLREVARERGVSDEVLDQALDYRSMAKPHG